MIETFINHSNKVHTLINSSDLDSIKESKNIIIEAILNKKNIYVAGNGGSFAIADHFICDFAKRVSEAVPFVTPGLLGIPNVDAPLPA